MSHRHPRAQGSIDLYNQLLNALLPIPKMRVVRRPCQQPRTQVR